MIDQAGGRRGFLKLAAGAAVGAAAMPPAIAQALALPARRRTGTIDDVEHVVILMQENRSFDHYFGTLRGVRGYGDPRPISLPGGHPVWLQPKKGGAGAVGPFHFDTTATRGQTIFNLDHSWKGSHARWMNHDAWVAAKGPLTMGYFTRADLPFYYALTDAFTVCDAYHCSIFGPTNPNRLFLFTGTSGLAAGHDGPVVVTNLPDDENDTADPNNDTKTFAGLTWPTYAERLQAAGVSWRVYQEFDNYGDNALAYFANFRGLDQASPLYQRGRAWSPGSHADNASIANGTHLVAQFQADVAADRLPQVSWIVAPFKLCEHPSASPADGEYLTARLIAALASKPEVWARTALILNYDENDGFFDHMPPPLPAVGAALGKSTADTAQELYHGEPVGLGPRVPLIVVSPWTKGGYVNSQLFDHTSVIRFLEARFGVAEPQISPWRRAVTGDLTSVFDFAGADSHRLKPLPDASGLPALAAASKGLPYPKPPDGPQGPPRQEPGQRPARALPYDFEVSGRMRGAGISLRIVNRGAAGAAFNLYLVGGEPHFYTVEAGRTLDDFVTLPLGPYDLELHGPNGFLRGFRGVAVEAEDPALEAEARFDAARGRLMITLSNNGDEPATLEVAPNAYLRGRARRRDVQMGAEVVDAWDVSPSGHWYDFIVTNPYDPTFQRRIAGHGEDGRPSISDPLLGRQS